MDTVVANGVEGLTNDTPHPRTTLIQTIRSLDQTGPGDNGENIQKIWTSLMSNGSDTYYAAEESALRWLLKSMKANNETAETLRRYPLTWRVIDCTFDRIPLFSLAKSLADRKFMAILQQTLKALFKPSDVTAEVQQGKRKKRKRPNAAVFDLSVFKSQEGCLATGNALLSALQTLLRRLDRSAQSPHDRMGSEHIRALFSQPASDVASSLAPILTLCETSFNLDADSPISHETWLDTMASVWSLRLQGTSDTLEVATVLSRPAFALLAKLKGSSTISWPFSQHIKALWTQQLEGFLHQNLMLPAKSAFFNHQGLEAPKRCLDMTSTMAASTLPVFFHVAITAPRLLTGSNSSRHEDEWAQEMFKLAVRASRHVDVELQPTLITSILEAAIANESSVPPDDLRAICDRDALAPSDTNWHLVSLVAQCDPDVFLLTAEGTRLLDIISERLLHATSDMISAHKFLDAIVRGYEDTRDLSSFMKRWYQYLSRADLKTISSVSNRSAWYAPVLRQNAQLIAAIKKTMNATQILDVVDWLEARPVLHPAAALVFLDTLALSITATAEADVIGMRLYDLSRKLSTADVPCDLRSLRWHIASRTVPWVDHETASRIWDSTSSELTILLQSGNLHNPETFQAFQFAAQLWQSVYPDGSQEPALADMLAMFGDRLAEDIGRSSSDEPPFRWDPHKHQTEPELFDFGDAVPCVTLYVNFCMGVSSRLLPLLAKQSETLPTFLRAVLSVPAKRDPYGAPQLESSLEAIFTNETISYEYKLTNRALDYVIDTLERSSKSSPWDSVRGVAALKTLVAVADELFSRQQRERLMELLHAQRRALKKPGKVSASTWNLVLGLMDKVARRPTFYEEMQFHDLLDLASAISLADTNAQEMLGLFHLLRSLSEALVQQMVDHYHERGSQYFVEAAKVAVDSLSTSELQSPLEAACICAVITALSPSPHFQTDNAPFQVQQVELRLLRSLEGCLGQLGNTQPRVSTANLVCHLEAATCLPEAVVREHFKLDVARLEKTILEIYPNGTAISWRLRTFLIKNFPQHLIHPRPTSFPGLLNSSIGKETEISPIIPRSTTAEVLRMCVDSILAQLDTPSRLQYLESLIQELGNGARSGVQILAIRYVVESIGDQAMPAAANQINLSAAHSTLAQASLKLSTSTELCQAAEVLQLLLDQNASSMTQWNIESTLGVVSAICAGKASISIQDSPAIFTGLCNLMSVVIRRHRLRLDDHYHILLSAMEAMLRALIRNAGRSPGSHVLRAKHATMYSRLITLITEPSAASVSRAQYVGALDSATDAAKRIAGRHVYLILMQYIKLQLELDVSREVREALEPGMHSVFDVTPPEVRKILNDAVDTGGRAILRDMFKRYIQFGKWSGV